MVGFKNKDISKFVTNYQYKSDTCVFKLIELSFSE